MATKDISIFVDESGSFDAETSSSRYYLVCLLIHDQANDISEKLLHLNDELTAIGVDLNTNIHVSPLIRREGEFVSLSLRERRRIFFRLLSFVRLVNVTYRCFKLDKRFVDETHSIHDILHRNIVDFLIKEAVMFETFDKIKVYYDNGQQQVTHILKDAFSIYSAKAEFVVNVVPSKYRLFQSADLICALELAATKLKDGLSLSPSENMFFGGPRRFRRNVLPQIRAKCRLT